MEAGVSYMASKSQMKIKDQIMKRIVTQSIMSQMMMKMEVKGNQMKTIVNFQKMPVMQKAQM